MRYGKRLFPYPTLNAEKVLNQYAESEFSFDYEVEIENNTFELKNIHYVLTNDYFSSLISEKKAKALMLVECPLTHFRQLYELPEGKSKVGIPISLLSGKINISAYIMATEDINPFTPNDLNSDYAGYSNFIVDKYDVIAIDDGYVEKVNMDEIQDDIVESIFTIIGDPSIKDETIQIQLNSEKIEIDIPTMVYGYFKRMTRLPDYKWIPYSMIIVPALIYAIDEIKKYDSVDMAKTEYTWFESICRQYKNIFNHEMDDDDLHDLNSPELAQKLVECPTSKALQVSFDLVSGKNDGGDENE